MNTPTTASAAVAPAASVAQPTAAPGSAGPESIVAVAPVNATPIKTANDIVNASPEALATRYGITEPATPETPAPTENAQGSAPTDEALASPSNPLGSDPAAPAAPAEAAPIEADAGTSADIIANPVTSLKLYDEKGELDIPANVKLAFKIDGKDYKDVTIDQVVRMAQQLPNIVNQKTAELTQAHQQAMQSYHHAAQEIARNNALYEQMLANPALYQEAATAYAAQNTPDQRIARLQQANAAQAQQFQQAQQQTQLQHITAAAQNFTATRIAPSVEKLTTQYPGVEAGDVMAKFHELTAPLLAPSPNGGVWVPPNRLGELESTVLPQLEAWTKTRAGKVAQSTAAASAAASAATTAATTQAKAQVQKAQLDAQLAKRGLARPLTPIGSKPAADVPKPIPIKSAGDAVEASIARARQSIAGLQ